MDTNPRSLKLAGLPIALSLLLSGCSQEKPGNAVPGPSSAAPSSSQSGNPANVFGDLKACELLEPTTTPKGFAAPEIERYESDNGCAAQKRGYASVSIYLVPEAGIDQLSPGQGTKVPTKVGGREAVEIPGDSGTEACTVAIAVTPTARMTASTSLNEGTNEEACALARELAIAAEPKLPKVS
ncbi:Protein of unknown function [Amycolatopsis lurida]|uniref:DUF3558 domain-containing protein n=1 Tax=Amycolatopsis lurida NRRL 2430 TaxID=1460371 RepID=A0A2P2FV51_AMYLU|nr:DUF3558 family protein [Amycolatopsis lurida]KFU80589.1 hypothetical protein BB31_13570 [Amycolatopsis lurida NRRL 2430]SED48516.1 Protein of unknown function [Amycolatopsis lurida]